MYAPRLLPSGSGWFKIKRPGRRARSPDAPSPPTVCLRTRLETALAQLRFAASVVLDIPFAARSLDRLVDSLLATQREFGAIGADGADFLTGPALDDETRRAIQLDDGGTRTSSCTPCRTLTPRDETVARHGFKRRWRRPRRWPAQAASPVPQPTSRQTPPPQVEHVPQRHCGHR
jgi:hypothetical protein